MVSIDTGALKKTAGQMEQNAQHYDRRTAGLEQCMYWIKSQQFREAEAVYRALSHQCEELYRQKQKWLLLSETIKSVCSSYDRTERRITEYRPFGQKIGQIHMVSLKQVQDYLQTLGMQIKDL